MTTYSVSYGGKKWQLADVYLGNGKKELRCADGSPLPDEVKALIEARKSSRPFSWCIFQDVPCRNPESGVWCGCAPAGFKFPSHAKFPVWRVRWLLSDPRPVMAQQQLSLWDDPVYLWQDQYGRWLPYRRFHTAFYACEAGAYREAERVSKIYKSFRIEIYRIEKRSMLPQHITELPAPCMRH